MVYLNGLTIGGM